MLNKFTQDVRTLIETAETEARLRNDSRVGAEHLLLALLHNAALSEQFLDGRDAAAGRRALADLGAAALRSVGVESVPNPTIREWHPAQLDFTYGAKAALQRALRCASGRRARRLEPRDLLLAIVTENGPSTAIDILHHMAIQPPQVAAALHAA